MKTMIPPNSRKVNPHHIIVCELQAKLLEQNYTVKQLFHLLGLLNRYIYAAGLDAGVFNPHSSDIRSAHFPKLFLAPTVIVRVTAITNYLATYWAGKALQGKKSVEKYRKILSEVFKIFTLEDRDWEEPLDRHRDTNPCGAFNMVRGLELANQIEQLLLNQFGFELEKLELDMSGVTDGVYKYVRVEEKSFPEHKGANLKRLYDMAFGPLGFFWGRTGEGTPDAYGAKDCAYKQDVGEPIPEVRAAIEKEVRSIQAEDKFAEICAFESERKPDEILETETVEIIESEIVEAGGIAALVDKIIDKIPLLNFVRGDMKVPAARPAGPEYKHDISIPFWVFEESKDALWWWKRRIEYHRPWLQNFVPSWVWTYLVPF